MKITFEVIQPNFANPVEVKALFAGEEGEGWCSPCPQVYTPQAAFVGYEQVKKLRDLCDHALSQGEWDDKPHPYINPPKTCEETYHKWIDIGNDRFICSKCFQFATKYGRILKDKVQNKAIAKIIANIIINDILKHCNEKSCNINELDLNPSDINWLAQLIFYDILDRTKVSKVIDHFVKYGGEIKEIIDQLDLWPKYDNKLEQMVEEVITKNPKIIEQILAGKEKAIGSLIGQLKQVNRNIDSKEAMRLLKEKIK